MEIRKIKYKYCKRKERKKDKWFECKFIYQLNFHTDLLEQLSGVEFVFCHLMC